MKKFRRLTLGFFDRASRIFLGLLALGAAFTLPLTTDWFAGITLASTYPLLTAMTAWDPVYSIFDFVRERFIDYHIFH